MKQTKAALQLLSSDAKAKIITDMGKSNTAVDQEGNKLHIPRYGVWAVDSRGKLQVIETSDDLEHLKTKYGIEKITPL